METRQMSAIKAIIKANIRKYVLNQKYKPEITNSRTRKFRNKFDWACFHYLIISFEKL
jgi:hypothetical protein